MTEIRRNPLNGDWVLFAPGRRARPQEFARSRRGRRVPRRVSDCPFCPGNEEMTPPPTLELPSPDGDGWAIRAFPNRYPALSSESTGDISVQNGLFERRPAVGAHEVIVESARHNGFPNVRSAGEYELLLTAYQDRSRALLSLPGVVYVLVFKNHGDAAGTSLIHPHSQLIGTPVLPPREQHIKRSADEYSARTGRCLVCDVVDQELREGERVVWKSGRFAVIEPFAAEHPGETWIMPTVHGPPFVDLGREALPELAEVLRRTLQLVADGLGDPDYNYALHQEPPNHAAAESQHWYIQVVPRLKEFAGFEIGSGMALNTLLPEAATELLRSKCG